MPADRRLYPRSDRAEERARLVRRRLGRDHHGAWACQWLAGVGGPARALWASPRGPPSRAGSRSSPNISRRRSAASPPASTISAPRSAACWRRLWWSCRSGCGTGAPPSSSPAPSLWSGRWSGGSPTIRAPRIRALSEEERAYIEAGRRRISPQRPTMPGRRRCRILRQRNFWGIALPRFLADPMWGMLTFWMPLYLTTARGFDLKQIALFAWLPFRRRRRGLPVRPGGGALPAAPRHRADQCAREWTFTSGASMMAAMLFVGAVRESGRGDRLAVASAPSRTRPCRSPASPWHRTCSAA